MNEMDRNRAHDTIRDRPSIIDVLWEDSDMSPPTDTHEISRDPNTWEPIEETGLQIPTSDPEEKKENPLDNPLNWIPSDDEQEPARKKQPTLH